jgi:hypothetical protein
VNLHPRRFDDSQRGATFLDGNPWDFLQPSLRWKGITMRKTLLALAAAATLAVSAASPAYAGPRTYPGPGGYPYWSGYVDAPVGDPVGPCYWRTERFWDGYAWRVRRVRICG